MTPFQKLETLMQNDRLRAYANRCWFTCYKAMSLLTAKERANVTMVEGQANGWTHYWLNVDGKVFDPHYRLLDHDMSVEDSYEYQPSKEMKFTDFNLDKESFEMKETDSWSGKVRFEKVYSLEC